MELILAVTLTVTLPEVAVVPISSLAVGTMPSDQVPAASQLPPASEMVFKLLKVIPVLPETLVEKLAVQEPAPVEVMS